MERYSSHPAYRYVFLIYVLIESWLLSGVMFGWPALVFVLKDEGYFEDMCNNTITNVTNTDCSDRDEMFTLYFALITTVGSLLGLVIGSIFRKFGTRVTRIVDSTGYAVDCLILAFAEKETHSLVCVGGIMVLACGISLMVTTFQITRLFPARSSLIVGLINGAMDSSVVVTLVMKELYDNYTISRKASFITLACLSISTLISTFVLFPKTYIEEIAKQTNVYVVNEEATVDNKNILKTGADTDGWLMFLKHRLFSPLFCSFNVWTSLNYLCYIYVLGTFNNTIERLTDGDTELVSYYTNAVSIVLFCAIIPSTLGGYMYDFQRRIFKHIDDTHIRSQMSAILPLCVTTLLAIVLSVLSYIKHEHVIYPSAVTVTLLRSLLYANMTVYVQDTFPVSDFGLLLPTTSLVMSLTGMIQYPLFRWANSYDGAYLHVNITLTVLCGVSFVHPINVYMTAHRKHTKVHELAENTPPAILNN